MEEPKDNELKIISSEAANNGISELIKESSKNIGIKIAELSGFILLIGIIKLVVYFEAFHVPIKYYISISGIAINLSDDILILIPFLMIALLGFTSGWVTRKIEESKSGDIQHRITYSYNIFLITTILLIIGASTIAHLFIINFTSLIRFVSVIGTIILLNTISYLSSLQVIKLTKILIAFFVTILTSIIFFKLSYEIDNVNSGLYTGTIIKTSDSTYISTKNSFYIGQVDKYIFIYNKSDSTTTLIPAESVKQIILKTNGK
jgi:hypothetical protein